MAKRNVAKSALAGQHDDVTEQQFSWTSLLLVIGFSGLRNFAIPQGRFPTH